MDASLFQRQQGQIVLYLSPKQPAPAIIPVELQGYINPDDWTVRIQTILNLGSKYIKPYFERIWTCLGIAALIALPIALYRIIVDAIESKENFSTASFFEARIASLAVFIVTLILFLVPITVWKFIGHRRMSALVQKWANEDSRKISGAFIPIWTVKMPTVFTSRLTLLITTPPNTPPTLFHRGAYMPSFIINTKETVKTYPNSTLNGVVAENGDEHVIDLPYNQANSTENVDDPFHDKKAENSFEDFVHVEQ